MKWIGNGLKFAIGWTVANALVAILIIFGVLTLCGCLGVAVTIITAPGIAGG